jgi:hypothetical protein
MMSEARRWTPAEHDAVVQRFQAWQASSREAELERLRAVEQAAREFIEAHRATEYAWTDRMDAAFTALRAALDPSIHLTEMIAPTAFTSGRKRR